jgi:hypothetical protein
MAKRSRNAIKEAAEAATRAFKEVAPSAHIGDLLYWDFAPAGLYSVDEVRDAWIATGLDPDADLPVSTDWSTAFGRAIEHAKRGRTGQHDCRLEFAADALDGSKRLAVVALKRNGTVTGDTIGIVTLPKSGLAGVYSAPFVEKADPYGIGDAVVSATCTTFLAKYTNDDLRSAVTVILDRWAATPCRQAPPHIVYYLPSPGAKTIRAVRDALVKIGAGTIHLVPMGTDAESVDAAASAANGGLEAQLSAFAAEADKWTTAPPSRTSTVENRIAEAERLRATGELYRAILGTAVADVGAKIESIQASMRRTLGIVESAREARA